MPTDQEEVKNQLEHAEFRRAWEESAEDRKELHAKIDSLADKMDEVLQLLKLGKAGIAFIKFLIAGATALAVFWTALSDFVLKRHA